MSHVSLVLLGLALGMFLEGWRVRRRDRRTPCPYMSRSCPIDYVAPHPEYHCRKHLGHDGVHE